MRTLIAVCLVLCCVLSGCASGRLEKTVIKQDGTKEIYVAKVSAVGLDSKTSDLKVYLDPKGFNEISAGAIDSTTSQITADVAKEMVEMFKLMIPLIQAAAPVPATPIP